MGQSGIFVFMRFPIFSLRGILFFTLTLLPHVEIVLAQQKQSVPIVLRAARLLQVDTGALLQPGEIDENRTRQIAQLNLPGDFRSNLGV